MRDHSCVAGEALTLFHLCVHLGLRPRGSLRRHIRALAEAGLCSSPRRFWSAGTTEQGGVGEPGADTGDERLRHVLPIGVDQQAHELRGPIHRGRLGGGQQARGPGGGSGSNS